MISSQVLNPKTAIFLVYAATTYRNPDFMSTTIKYRLYNLTLVD